MAIWQHRSQLEYSRSQAARRRRSAEARARHGVVDADRQRPAWSRALIQLHALNDAYLLVVRMVDPQVFGYYQRNRAAVGGI